MTEVDSPRKPFVIQNFSLGDINDDNLLGPRTANSQARVVRGECQVPWPVETWGPKRLWSKTDLNKAGKNRGD